MPYHFALELYSVRNAYRENFEDCVAKVAEMGYEGVEPFGGLVQPAERVVETLRRHRLALVGWHTPIELLEGDAFEETVRYFKAVGNPRAIVPGIGEENFATPEATLAFARRLSAIADRLRPHGIALGYHNHFLEFRPFPDGRLPWAVLLDNADIIGQLDNGNALASGNESLDVVKLVKQWKGRAATVHLKPYSKADGFATMIGQDDIDWDSFLDAAAHLGGMEWGVVEYEDTTKYTEFEGARLCLEALRAIAQ